MEWGILISLEMVDGDVDGGKKRKDSVVQTRSPKRESHVSPKLKYRTYHTTLANI